jgi:hypothetical protein
VLPDEAVNFGGGNLAPLTAPATRADAVMPRLRVDALR